MENDAQWGTILLAYAVLVVVPATAYIIFLHWRAGTLRKAESTPPVAKVENRLLFLGLGFVLIMTARALGWLPLVGAFCAATYVTLVLTFPSWRPREGVWHINSWNLEKSGQTIGLRIMFASLALLIILIGAGDAIADWLPYDPDHYSFYDFFEARWPHVIVSLVALWGGYFTSAGGQSPKPPPQSSPIRLRRSRGYRAPRLS